MADLQQWIVQIELFSLQKRKSIRGELVYLFNYCPVESGLDLEKLSGAL